MDARLRALCDLHVASVRENAGLHDYDGVVQDLSPDGVARGLAALGAPGRGHDRAHDRADEQAGAPGDGPGDERGRAHDEAHLRAAEEHARVVYGEVGLHRSNPFVHLGNLDLACYDRDYAPAPERAAARLRHLAGWPAGVAAALESLDAVPAPVAEAALPAVHGLAAGLDPEAVDGADQQVVRQALAAHARLVGHLESAATHGERSAALGGPALARLLSTAEAVPVDLTAMAAQAERERDRLRGLLADACGELAPGEPVAEVVARLLADHPDADGVLDEARALTEEVIAWTAEHDLVPSDGGECRVGPAPPSRRWAMAMMSWAAPYEPDAPSWYHVTPPEPTWPPAEQEEWLAVFSRTTLPAITVHEVAPGHFSHGRALRHAGSDVRRTLLGEAFVEGWAHYVEEVAVEEGFRAGDPRFRIGVAVEALVRVTRMACAIGVHTGAMTVRDAALLFTEDAFLQGPAALSEARRATFDPTYGRYTWGKLAIFDLREQARQRWGAGFSLPRLHRALLALGSPPLGLMGTALDSG